MKQRNTFPKEERLCGKLRIANLYKSGKHHTVYPLRMTYCLSYDFLQENEGILSTSNTTRTKVLVWAPKSKYKHAVARNRLRRLMRESYRLNAHCLRDICSDKHCSLEVAFNYIGTTICDYPTMEKSMRKALLFLETQLKSNNA